MRILFINQVFYPDVASTAQHAHDLAKHLVARGHQVSVIASRSLYGQSGSLLPKYEVVDGIRIHRVGRSLFGKRSFMARLADFGIFYIAALFKAVFVRRPHVVICLTTPPLIALVGAMLKIFKRCKFIYWVMDLYPDLPIGMGVMSERGFAARTCERIHRFVLRRADRVVVLGRCMMQRVLAKGVDPARVRHIHVWSDSEEVAPFPREHNPLRREWSLGDAFIVMYAGNYGVGHDVQTMLNAALLLAGRNDIKFVFSGGGVRKPEVERFMQDHGMINGQLRPYLPRERLGELLSVADLHLASQKEHVVGMFVPSKLFGIMGAARPAVFIGSPFAENALVLRESQCGEVIRAGDAVSLAAMIQHFAENPAEARAMGERGRQALIEHYSRRDGCEQWEKLIVETAGKPGE